MYDHQELSPSSMRYLNRYDQILQDMIQGMTRPCPTDSISGLFIRQMIPHHEAAILMSENLLKYTLPGNPMPLPYDDDCYCSYRDNVVEPLNKIAENIIEEQTKSIENMKASFYCCSQYKNSPREIRAYQNAFRSITNTMFTQMRRALRTDEIPYNFIREMIPHHEGAIRMSENTLRFSICPELIPILDAIITSQEKGVQEMQELLLCRQTDIAHPAGKKLSPACPHP